MVNGEFRFMENKIIMHLLNLQLVSGVNINIIVFSQLILTFHDFKCVTTSVKLDDIIFN